MTHDSQHRDRLIAVNTEAHRYYREQLLISLAAQGPCRYLTQRRLAHVLAADAPWPVGYAPAGWTTLTDHLHQAGFSNEEVVAAGMACRTRHGGIIDRFRDRIMLAQRNHHGDIVGFIGRAAPGARAGSPKYLNSPRTDIYDKRELLFGLHEQRDALAQGSRPVIVEGPLDVLAIAVTNFEVAGGLVGVAPCGTALTTEQVSLLVHHFSDREGGVVVAYDNDDAGRKATRAAYDLLADSQLLPSKQFMAALLPRGADPAEVLQVHGPRALHGTLSDPRRLVPLGQHAIDSELRTWTHVLDGAEGRIAAVKAVAPLVAKLPCSAVAGQVARLAQRVGLDPTTVTIALTEALGAVESTRGGRCTHSRDSGTTLRTMSAHPARAPCRHVL